MWSQQNASPSNSWSGNVFIKNLDKSINNDYMYDTFSVFGNILSCEVAIDEDMESKGYGFVQFDTEEAANNAILKVNGMVLVGRKVYVGKFIPREEREKMLGEKDGRFRNIYVKNFPKGMDDDTLHALFEKYGKITSAKVMKNEMGKSEGFGFVNFEDPESAQKAVDDLNGKDISGKPLYVGRAQKKEERQVEIKQRLEERLQEERLNRYRGQGINLIVKNLDDVFDDERLRKEFNSFGTITSAKVMIDRNGRSMCFGFVCFSTPEEATKAIFEMNGRIVISKPLYVALAQKRKDRKVNLTFQYKQRMAGVCTQKTGQMFNPASPGYFVPTFPQVNRGYFPPQMPIGAATPRWITQPQIRPGCAQSAPAFQTVPCTPYGPAPATLLALSAPQNPSMRAIMNAHPITSQLQNIAATSAAGRVPTMGLAAVSAAQQASMFLANVAQSRAAALRFSANMHNPPRTVTVQQGSVQQPFAQKTVHMQVQKPLTTSMLASANLEKQKQMLRERLFPIIHGWYPELAEKVTKILLEIDNSELLHMLEHKEFLKSKVEEAVAVLKPTMPRKPSVLVV